ncbi:MAG: DUF861 domain-containing protein [Anaerolineae bacterium]|nr:DUF861 domain-containing protein [Anaerolineae bacterium]
MKKRLITAADIRGMKDAGERRVAVARGDLVTALALDAARELGIEVCYESEGIRADVPAWSGAAQCVYRQRSPAQFAVVSTSPSPAPLPPVDVLETRVREIVAALVQQGHAPAPSASVRHIAGRGLRLEPFPLDVGHPEMDIRVLDVVTRAHGSPMAGGLMSFRKGAFSWTLNYDEIEYVIEGELHIGTPNGTVIGLPGDVLYVPKGTNITFGTPEWAKFFYVTYPAEWGG